MKVTFKKVHSWKDNAVYQATNSKLTIIFSIESVRDRVGTLKRVMCSQTNDFESYSMAEIKNKIASHFN